MEYQFRNTTFGGFNRQDVMDYLERTTKEHSAQVAELQAKVAQMDEMQARLDAIEGEQATLAQEKTDAQQKIADLEAQMKCAQSENATLHAANEEAQAKVFALTPDAEAYRAVKERATGMELEAHLRAQKTIENAKAEAKNLRDDSQQWSIEMKNQYSRMRGEIATALDDAMANLKTANQTVSALSKAMKEKDQAMETLITEWNKKASK